MIRHTPVLHPPPPSAAPLFPIPGGACTMRKSLFGQGACPHHTDTRYGPLFPDAVRQLRADPAPLGVLPLPFHARGGGVRFRLHLRTHPVPVPAPVHLPPDGTPDPALRDVPPRRMAPRDRQHALPLHLRRQRGGHPRPRKAPDLITFVRSR